MSKSNGVANLKWISEKSCFFPAKYSELPTNDMGYMEMVSWGYPQGPRGYSFNTAIFLLDKKVQENIDEHQNGQNNVQLNLKSYSYVHI